MVVCAVGALVGLALDAGIELVKALWRWRKPSFSICSMAVSAVVGCFTAGTAGYLWKGVLAIKAEMKLLEKIFVWLIVRGAAASLNAPMNIFGRLGCISVEKVRRQADIERAAES